MQLVFPLLLIALPAAVLADDNAVYQMLMAEGVTLSDGTTIKLPAPTVADGADANAQREMVEQAAGRTDYASFVRKSRVAPFELQMKSVKNKSGARTGQIVDVWFVVYGRLDEIERHLREEMKRPQPHQSDEGKGRALTADDLSARDIEPPAEANLAAPRYGYFETSLLERVRLSGVTRSTSTRQSESFLAAFLLDERFAKDKQFPNQWQPIEVNELGEQYLGSPEPYSGCGGYVKATELREPAGALLVEAHVVFNEPNGWFDGANLLRSKLPLVIQERVRDFRGELERREVGGGQ